MAVGVVDGLEVVEVEQHEGQRAAEPLEVADAVGERDVEGAAVGQAREVVGQRLVDGLAQLLDAALELARHLVELLAEAGELVFADRRDLGREVAAGELLRGVEEALQLLLQRARDEGRAGEREEQEADEDRRDRDAAAARPAAVGTPSV